MSRLENLGSVSNGAETFIAMGQPYAVRVVLVGVAPLIMHAWNVESIDEKSKAAKGSKSKKTDDVESYVYRNKDGFISIPGEYLRMSIVNAAKYRQDPRSPRKSAMDLFKAGVVSLTIMAPFEPNTVTWDYLDARRVQIQRAGVTRIRPAMTEGWKLTFDLQVLLPEYIPPSLLQSVINDAGRLVGLANYRPTFGRFNVTSYSVL